ncbi:c-type cytochrome [Abyssibacter sp.]|jgi:cytochrome c553|uniref:c-type cytochrome n=1 Tax=Abyssibacter sp. TaxID=2320200 RepID=UPI0025C0DB1F|nr:c-type cytochrome [Abyssibacter sp.]MCK5860049.1 cytochrome c4 [Abyssibacter sp.]
MIDVLRTSAAALAFALAGSAFAAENHHSLAKGDAKAGAEKAAPCAACHGPDGNSVNPEWPKIAGQSAKYLETSLQAYKAGERQNALMAGQVMNLSDQDMTNLAAHFAAQTHKPGAGSEDSIEVAEPLYRGGDAERNIPACLACHGPSGKGNAAAGWPHIGGQHAAYLATALKAYRAGERNSSANGQMMTEVAQELTDAEIEALAGYVAGLQ